MYLFVNNVYSKLWTALNFIWQGDVHDKEIHVNNLHNLILCLVPFSIIFNKDVILSFHDT